MLCWLNHKTFEYLKMVLAGKIFAFGTWLFFLMHVQTLGSPDWKYCYKWKTSKPRSGVCTWKLIYSFLFSHLMSGNSPLWNSLQEQRNSCRGSWTKLLGDGWMLWASHTTLCLRTEQPGRGHGRGLTGHPVLQLLCVADNATDNNHFLCSVLISSHSISDLIFPPCLRSSPS